MGLSSFPRKARDPLSASIILRTEMVAGHAGPSGRGPVGGALRGVRLALARWASRSDGWAADELSAPVDGMVGAVFVGRPPHFHYVATRAIARCQSPS